MERKDKNISIFAIISFCAFALVMAALIAAKLSPSTADLLNGTVCRAFRQLMAGVGGLFPFSLFEALVISLPLIITLIIISAVRRAKRGYGMARFVINLLAAVLLIYSGHTLALGIGYNTTEISEKAELSDTQITEDNLALAMTLLRDEVNARSLEISYGEDGTSHHGYTMSELSMLLCDSYDSLDSRFGLAEGFPSVAKGVYFSSAMSYLGITGIYTYYTGEANVNMAYPDYDTVFSAAHELSHQRGVMRENEANFVAYLICTGSSDAYLRYSGALRMYEYVSSALYRTSEARYLEISSGLCDGARVDMRASKEVSQRYGDTLIADVSSFINDLFLKSNGTDGVVTYGRVVSLAVAYLTE